MDIVNICYNKVFWSPVARSPDPQICRSRLLSCLLLLRLPKMTQTLILTSCYLAYGSGTLLTCSFILTQPISINVFATWPVAHLWSLHGSFLLGGWIGLSIQKGILTSQLYITEYIARQTWHCIFLKCFWRFPQKENHDIHLLCFGCYMFIQKEKV